MNLDVEVASLKTTSAQHDQSLQELWDAIQYLQNNMGSTSKTPAPVQATAPPPRSNQDLIKLQQQVNKLQEDL